MAEITQVEVALSGPVAITSVIISDAPGADGADGEDGAPGADGVGIPAGGTTGQVLEKASGTDYDTVWATPSGGSGSGDVVGPSSSTTARIATFNGTTGKLIQDGGSTIANVLDRANHTSTQAISTVSGLQAALDTKAASSHTHAISDTTGLQTALDGKASSSHTHAAGDITGLATSATTDTTSATNITTGTLPIARIADGDVSLAKMANLAQSTLVGRHTASTGVPQEITIGSDFSVSGGTLALSSDPTNATNLASGTVADARLSSNVPLINAANTFTANGAASASARRMSGTVYTGGTGTTTYPFDLLAPSGVTMPTTWSTSGTMLGAVAPSGFGGNFLHFSVNGAASVASLTAAGIWIGSALSTSGGYIYFGSGSDVQLLRRAANTLQQGQPSATPATQTLQGQSGSGTNIAGGKLCIGGGIATGNATPGTVAIQTSTTAASSSTAQTLADRLTVSETAITALVPVVLKSYTVGTLPTGVTGMRAYVTDATAPTYNGALTGGGAVVCPVFYNGSAWVSG